MEREASRCRPPVQKVYLGTAVCVASASLPQAIFLATDNSLVHVVAGRPGGLVGILVTF